MKTLITIGLLATGSNGQVEWDECESSWDCVDELLCGD